MLLVGWTRRIKSIGYESCRTRNTRQFQLDEAKEKVGPANQGAEDSTELSVGDSVAEEGSDKLAELKKKKKEKKGPGKLPANYKAASSESSKDAADDALKRFFSGR